MIKRKYLIISAVIVGICAALFLSFTALTKQKENPGKIVFCERDNRYWQIWRSDLDGSNKKNLTSSEIDKRSPDLSYDGRKIVYVTNDGKLWVMDTKGENSKNIALDISACEPRWCFQDKKIVFTSYRGISFLDDSDIWIVDADGSNLEKLTRRPSLQFLPDISKDGKEMVFVDVLELAGHEIFRIDLKTKNYTQLTENRSHDTAPVFTPDGSRIVYSSDEDGNYDIWIMDRFGQDKKNLTHRPAYDSSPAIANNGKVIYFLSDESGATEIWSMDMDGGSITQVTNDGNDKQDISVYAP